MDWSSIKRKAPRYGFYVIFFLLNYVFVYNWNISIFDERKDIIYFIPNRYLDVLVICSVIAFIMYLGVKLVRFTFDMR